MNRTILCLALLGGCCPQQVATPTPQPTARTSGEEAPTAQTTASSPPPTSPPTTPVVSAKGQPALSDAEVKAQLENFDFTGDADPDYETMMAGRDQASGTIVEELRGRSSYYADKFHGRTTANGEVYHKEKFTAASRDLRFGTIVRVIRESGPSVIVRINDRGPFRDHSRILDLSRAAAKKLQMEKAGVVNIRAHILYVPEKSVRRKRRR